MRDPTAVELLIRAVKDEPEASVRLAAMEVLAKIGGREALERVFAERLVRVDTARGALSSD